MESGHFDKEPVNFIFDENGHLSSFLPVMYFVNVANFEKDPTYQAIDLGVQSYDHSEILGKLLHCRDSVSCCILL